VPDELAVDNEIHIHQWHWLSKFGGCVRKATSLTRSWSDADLSTSEACGPGKG
jgi:hypothetical protein